MQICEFKRLLEKYNDEVDRSLMCGNLLDVAATSAILKHNATIGGNYTTHLYADCKQDPSELVLYVESGKGVDIRDIAEGLLETVLSNNHDVIDTYITEMPNKCTVEFLTIESVHYYLTVKINEGVDSHNTSVVIGDVSKEVSIVSPTELLSTFISEILMDTAHDSDCNALFSYDLLCNYMFETDTIVERLRKSVQAFRYLYPFENKFLRNKKGLVHTAWCRVFKLLNKIMLSWEDTSMLDLNRSNSNLLLHVDSTIGESAEISGYLAFKLHGFLIADKPVVKVLSNRHVDYVDCPHIEVVDEACFASSSPITGCSYMKLLSVEDCICHEIYEKQLSTRNMRSVLLQYISRVDNLSTLFDVGNVWGLNPDVILEYILEVLQ